MEIQELQETLRSILQDVLEKAHLEAGDLFVLGCSTSEVQGAVIGKSSNLEIGYMIVQTIKEELDLKGIHLAVQGCEHINRALVIEKRVARHYQLEEVRVVPSLHAGGACSVAAFDVFEEPIEVEHVVAKAGLDIGDTFIGMHIRHVQVPIRPQIKQLGSAHVTAVTSRPKYIGGPRAAYSFN